jgi:hypothetical protein
MTTTTGRSYRTAPNHLIRADRRSGETAPMVTPSASARCYNGYQQIQAGAAHGS